MKKIGDEIKRESYEFAKRHAKSIIAFSLAFLFFGYFMHISMQRELEAFEMVMFQFFISGFGIWGSFTAGKSAKEKASDIITPHARSAFRRILVLYNRLFTLAREVEQTRKANEDNQKLSSELDKIRFILEDQIQTIDSSLEDWRDIVPEEVAEVEENLEERIEKGREQ